MTDIFAMCPQSMKDRANNLAEGLARIPGSGIQTFDLCPRVVDGNGNVWLWASFQRSVSIIGEADYFSRLNADAKALLASAVTIMPDMLGPDGTLPDIAGKFVIAPGINAQTILVAYWMAPTE